MNRKKNSLYEGRKNRDELPMADNRDLILSEDELNPDKTNTASKKSSERKNKSKDFEALGSKRPVKLVVVSGR